MTGISAKRLVAGNQSAWFDMLDAYDHRPPEPGWYAANWCWDEEEGVFFGALYWSGSEWRWEPDEVPICHVPVGTFHPRYHGGRAEAKALADEIYPDGAG